MTNPEPDIIIDQFQTGIAPSPHLGISDMRNIDIYSKPGSAQLTRQLNNMCPSPLTTTVTANSSTDILTLASGTLQYHSHAGTNRAVTFSTSGTLPSPLVAGTVYFVSEVSSSTYKVATTLDNANSGTTIDITTTGSGTHTLTSVDPVGIQYFAYDGYGSQWFAQDTAGRIWQTSGNADWYLITGNTLVSAYGLAIWKNYLFAFRGDYIDVYGSLTAARSSRTWTNSWQALTNTAGGLGSHVTLVGFDDKLYFADRDNTTSTPYIGSIAQATGTFAPATPATYSVVLKQLTLPTTNLISGIEELGINIFIGTTGRHIYPWNRSDTTAGIPIVLAESNVSAMRTVNNVLYFSAGTAGNIYSTTGTQTRKVAAVPVYLSEYTVNTIDVGAMDGFNGKLYFTVESAGLSGVWSLDTSSSQVNPQTGLMTSGALTFEHQYSTGTYGSPNLVGAKALAAVNSTQFMVGWRNTDASTYGIDIPLLHTNNYFTPTYLGYIESKLFVVGSPFNKRTFTQLDFELAKPLVSGQGIRVSYRKTLADSYTVLNTFDFTTYGAISSMTVPANIPATETVQFKVELTTAASNSTTPELRIVSIR